MILSSDLSRTIGPHVVEPSDETITSHRTGKSVGEFTAWTCTYCDASGTHPEESSVAASLSWAQDCNGVEWRDTDDMALDRMCEKGR